MLLSMLMMFCSDRARCGDLTDMSLRRDRFVIARPLTLRLGALVNWKSGQDVIILTSISDAKATQKFPQGWKTVKPYLRITPRGARKIIAGSWSNRTGIYLSTRLIRMHLTNSNDHADRHLGGPQGGAQRVAREPNMTDHINHCSGHSNPIARPANPTPTHSASATSAAALRSAGVRAPLTARQCSVK